MNTKQLCDSGSVCDSFVIVSDTSAPSVTITASDTAGASLSSGGATGNTVTFTFFLSEASQNFDASGVTENCVGESFFGAKQRYFLRCPFNDGTTASVSVAANTFTDFAGKANTQAQLLQ